MKRYLMLINLLLGIFNIPKPKTKKKLLAKIKRSIFGK